MITILAVGKKHEDWVAVGVERYQKRLRKPYDVTWELIPHSHAEGARARQEESERLLTRIKDDSYVILLDERGKNMSSPELSTLLNHTLQSSQSIVVIIGGAYGVDARVAARATTQWSLSKLVFPHQLVRLVLVEQLYRAQSIAAGSAYHHE